MIDANTEFLFNSINSVLYKIILLFCIKIFEAIFSAKLKKKIFFCSKKVSLRKTLFTIFFTEKKTEDIDYNVIMMISNESSTIMMMMMMKMIM